MAPFEDFNIDFDSKIKVQSSKESLHINRNTQKQRIKFSLKAMRFRDKDTKQFVVYIPSLEITSYGATEKKAMEMLKTSVDDFCAFVTKLSTKKMESELAKLGWKQNQLKKKDYSKAYIDIDGNLKSFNALQDKFELVDLKMSA